MGEMCSPGRVCSDQQKLIQKEVEMVNPMKGLSINLCFDIAAY